MWGWKQIGRFSSLIFWRCQTGCGRKINVEERTIVLNHYYRCLVIIAIWAGAVSFAAAIATVIHPALIPFYLPCSFIALIVSIDAIRHLSLSRHRVMGDEAC